LDLDKPEQTI